MATTLAAQEVGSTVTLTSDGEDVNATISGKTLVMEQDGQSLTFEKQ